MSHEDSTSKENDESILRPLEDGDQDEEADALSPQQMQQPGHANQVRPDAGFQEMEE